MPSLQRFHHLLNDLLRGTPYPERLTSAAPLLSKLRSRKSPTEVERIKAAIATTEEIVELTSARIRTGVSEAEIGAFVHEQFKARGLPSAWAWDACPIVNSGADSEPGHGAPRADIMVAPGHLVHIDLGVQQDGYCSDIQRMWYVRRPGEDQPPPAIRRAFATVLQAIEAGAAALKPGVRGYEIDQIARDVIVDSGYEEYKHAFGHGLGRACHDGGTLLGPRWPRYGATPEGIVEIAYGVALEYEGRGYGTEAAEALVKYAVASRQVRLLRAHTLPETNASGRILTKNGFACVGEVMDPEDGRVWRWERRIDETPET